ncbi:MAG: hypothetical protein IKE43_13405 [Coriobacteriales bacterium]|nr:hypothetical protein [Coriobacteriales bacterium]
MAQIAVFERIEVDEMRLFERRSGADLRFREDFEEKDFSAFYRIPGKYLCIKNARCREAQ